MSDTPPVSPVPVQPVVVTLPAEFDVGISAGIYIRITAAFDLGAPVVVVDMTATIYCDTMAIRTLVMAHRQAAVTGTELRLVVTSPSILRVMELLGIHKVLSVYARVDEALAGQNRLGFG